METLIAVIASLPVVILKILPRIKPVSRVNRKRLESAPLPQLQFKSLHRDVLVRHEEVQQRPELFEGVLQRSPSDEQSVVGPELH